MADLHQTRPDPNAGIDAVGWLFLAFAAAIIAVAAVIADARDAVGKPRWFVIGVDRATPGSWWKIAVINEGRAPIASSIGTVPGATGSPGSRPRCP